VISIQRGLKMKGWNGVVVKSWSGLWMDGVVERDAGDAEPKSESEHI